MELTLKNIGRIEKARIKVDGITVICGDNNTGKSTVGKILYVIYQTFCDFQEKVDQERVDALKNLLRREVPGLQGRTGRELTEELKHLFKAIYEDSSDDTTISRSKIYETIISSLAHDDIGKVDKESLEAIISSVIEQEESDILGVILRNLLRVEFGTRIGNVNYPRRRSEVKLSLKDGTIHFTTVNGGIKPDLKNYINLKKRIIYIDDPFLLDTLDGLLFYKSNMRYNHRMALQNMLLRGTVFNRTNAVEDLITAKRVKPILEKFDTISSGNLTYKEGTVKYEAANLKGGLDLVSVSTGIKSFIILKELLMNGGIEENGIIVIDEPEVHLHPEWQVRYAEIIVMLQKYYGLNILLTTHSDEFLSAIQLYTQRYGIEEKCHYYMTKLKKAEDANEVPLSFFEETTKNLDDIYASLSQPYLDIYSQLNEGG